VELLADWTRIAETRTTNLQRTQQIKTTGLAIKAIVDWVGSRGCDRQSEKWACGKQVDQASGKIVRAMERLADVSLETKKVDKTTNKTGVVLYG